MSLFPLLSPLTLLPLAGALVLLLIPPALRALFLDSSLLPFLAALPRLKPPILLGFLVALSGRSFPFALNLAGNHAATGWFSRSWRGLALSALACAALLAWCGSIRLVGKPVRSLRLGSRSSEPHSSAAVVVNSIVFIAMSSERHG